MGKRLTLLVLTAFAGLPIQAVQAQSALGDGRALDRPQGGGPVGGPNYGGGRGGGPANYSNPSMNSGRNFADEIRFRNAIVTGNAPGGFSFRGDVGYRAPGELLTRVGSDANFAFRRDSFFSGLGGLGIRGTDALQYQFALSTGSRPPDGIAARLNADTSRAGADTPPPQQGRPNYNQQDQFTRPVASQRQDTRGMALAAMRSPSAYNSARSLEPSLMGISNMQGQPYGMVASSLRGVAVEPLNKTKMLDRIDAERDANAPANRQDLSAPISDVRDNTFDSRRDPSALPEGDPLGPQASKSIVDEALERHALAVGGGSTMDRIRALRGQLDDKPTRGGERGKADPNGLTGPAGPNTKPQLGDQPGPNQANQARPEEEDPFNRKPKDGEKDDPKDPKKPVTSKDRQENEKKAPVSGRQDLDAEAIEAIRSLDVKIDSFVPKGFDAYAEHMTAGQQLLKEGRYFDAEGRFTAALGVRPDDVTAAIARVNAALGAGLNASAALNLRTLLVEHPELAGVKFSNDTLPAPDRLKNIKQRLRKLITEPEARKRDLGLLMAYTGFQTADKAMLDDGLLLMSAERQPEEGMAAEQMVRLSKLLRAVWIIEAPKGAGEPAPAPKPPEKGAR